MLATLNSKQIVDEIIKDTGRDNDPHDVLDISPDVILASRTVRDAPVLAPDDRAEAAIRVNAQPAAAAPSVDSAVRAAAVDLHGNRRGSSSRKWLRGAVMTLLLGVGSAAATVVWRSEGDTAKQVMSSWMPAVLSSSQATPAASEQTVAATPASPATQPEDQAAAPVSGSEPANSASAATADAVQTLQSMTRDMAAMSQQIEQLKANLAELKAGHDQLSREMAAKSAATKATEAKPVDPRTKLSAVPPRAPAPPARKPRPAYAPAPAQTYAPAPIAPAPVSQATAVPPPMTASDLADDNGPVVRPPMPLR